MSQVTLCGDCATGATIVSNDFIDCYMGDANDAQIKIYLYLLRCIGGSMPVSVSEIADFFNFTEKDVLRALKYWDKQKVLKLTFSDSKQLSGITMLPVKRITPKENCEEAESKEPVYKAGRRAAAAEQVDRGESRVFKLPEKPNYSAEKLMEFRGRADISQLLFIAEQYMKKTLNSNEVASFLYMYDSLGFDADLMEYLVEYCVNNKKKSIRYIETVANSWAIAGIRYVEEAKEYTANVPDEIYEVFKAFGIPQNRTPIESEVAYVRRWLSFGYGAELISEACTRTIMATHTPSFEYTDTIITNWNKANVHSLADVEKLDMLHKQKRTNVRGENEKTISMDRSASGTRFNNFKQRTYDFSALEQEAFS